MKMDTSEYPYPLEKMRGTWDFEEAPDGGLISMRVDYRFRYCPLGALFALFDRLFARRFLFAPVCEGLLDNWEREVLERREILSRR
jgi:ribosome-associated toxin RatA of RatAB toxin-antitoxin module